MEREEGKRVTKIGRSHSYCRSDIHTGKAMVANMGSAGVSLRHIFISSAQTNSNLQKSLHLLQQEITSAVSNLSTRNIVSFLFILLLLLLFVVESMRR